MTRPLATPPHEASLPRRVLDHALFALTMFVRLTPFCALAYGATHIINPGQSIQEAIDSAADGDVIVLSDGVYHESVNIHKSITLEAEHGGEATVTNRHEGAVTWVQTSAGSQTWFAVGIDWPVHGLLVEGVHAFDYRSKQNFDNRTCGPYWSKGWQAGTYS